MDMILMVAWGIWKNRNEVRHGGKKVAAAEIYGTTSRRREEYIATQMAPSATWLVQGKCR